MESLQRINVKFYLEDPASLSAQEAFRIFNSWIPTTPDEVLIDVADYSHLDEGPLTILVGHEANYSLDNHSAELGLALLAQTTRGRRPNRTACQHLQSGAHRLPTPRRRAQPSGQSQIPPRRRIPRSQRPPQRNQRRSRAKMTCGPSSIRYSPQLFAGAEYAVKRDPAPELRLNLRIRMSNQRRYSDPAG